MSVVSDYWKPELDKSEARNRTLSAEINRLRDRVRELRNALADYNPDHDQLKEPDE